MWKRKKKVLNKEESVETFMEYEKTRLKDGQRNTNSRGKESFSKRKSFLLGTLMIVLKKTHN